MGSGEMKFSPTGPEYNLSPTSNPFPLLIANVRPPPLVPGP
jgi:hypothetical protein